jgi:glutaryl-CoA dehydrogenase
MTAQRTGICLHGPRTLGDLVRAAKTGARFVGDAEAIYSYEGTREMNTLIVGRVITGPSAFV